jgi:hypothetical protein
MFQFLLLNTIRRKIEKNNELLSILSLMKKKLLIFFKIKINKWNEH